jgi:hypothetical protein
MEISLVAIPANAEATRQFKALGLNPVELPRDILDAVRRGVDLGIRSAMMSTGRYRP